MTARSGLGLDVHPLVAGRPLVLEKGLKVKPVSLSPKEMDFLRSSRLTRDEILDVLRLQSGVLRARFRVKSIGLFGSYASGHQRSHSDIDLLVRFEKQRKTFDNFMEVRFLLESIFTGMRVDLVLEEAIKPAIRDRILSEATDVA